MKNIKTNKTVMMSLVVLIYLTSIYLVFNFRGRFFPSASLLRVLPLLCGFSLISAYYGKVPSLKALTIRNIFSFIIAMTVLFLTHMIFTTQISSFVGFYIVWQIS